MASKKDRGIALLSIRPRHVTAILAGTKTVEFRKTAFARPIDHVVIYATHPIKKIVAFFRVAQVNVAAPKEIWADYGSAGGIEQGEFASYYLGFGSAVAIEIQEVVELSKPIPLKRLSKSLSAPQSYAYLDEAVFERICRFNTGENESVRQPGSRVHLRRLRNQVKKRQIQNHREKQLPLRKGK